MFQRTDDGLLAAGKAALAPAENAVVRLDLHQKLVADADLDGIALDRSDLHLVLGSPVPQRAVLETVHWQIRTLVRIFRRKLLVDIDAVADHLARVQVAVGEGPGA